MGSHHQHRPNREIYLELFNLTGKAFWTTWIFPPKNSPIGMALGPILADPPKV
jgi:hypothetical protein